MKVIDLLNKIANGEEVPVKIKFRNDIFRYTGCSYYCDAMHTTFFNIYNFAVLNERVEIIEKNKKIEKLPDKNIFCTTGEMTLVVRKLNELIDKIDKMEVK